MKNVVEIKYLNYWWNPKSVIDPSSVKHNYYVVYYDNKGRRVKIESYNKDSEALGSQYFHWLGSWLVQVDDYSPENVLQYKMTYHYNQLGFLVERKVFSKDGAFLGSALNSEQDTIDYANQWLSDLVAFPIVELTGLINYLKRLFPK